MKCTTKEFWRRRKTIRFAQECCNQNETAITLAWSGIIETATRRPPSSVEDIPGGPRLTCWDWNFGFKLGVKLGFIFNNNYLQLAREWNRKTSTILSQDDQKSSPKPQKIELWSGLGVYWKVLGATWKHFGRSWKHFGRLGEVLGASCTELGASWRVLEPLGDVLGSSWGVLGGSWGVCGRSWRLPGTILEDFFADFLAS